MALSNEHTNVVFGCHLTGIYDINRNMVLPDDEYKLVEDWADAIIALGMYGIIFHNHFSAATCASYQNKNIFFVKVEHNPKYNPNVYRYFIYRDFLKATSREIKNLFITDITDVTVINNPFIQPVFLDKPAALFCGDEPKLLNNDWMIDHATHLRNGIADYAGYEATFKNAPLLNCGIIGGNIFLMQEFLEKLCFIHQQYNHNNKTAYTGDMGAFNYLARTQYNDRVVHGAPVNTEFKAYQQERTDCWFRHK